MKIQNATWLSMGIHIDRMGILDWDYHTAGAKTGLRQAKGGIKYAHSLANSNFPFPAANISMTPAVPRGASRRRPWSAAIAASPVRCKVPPGRSSWAEILHPCSSRFLPEPEASRR